MVNAGIKDIFITNEVVSKEKIERLIMINRHANVKIAIDNLEIAKIISKAAIKRNVQQDVLVEVDVRNKRCGVAPGKPTLDLVKEVIKLKGLRFRGLMGYEGPFFGLINFEERKRAAYQLLALLKETIELVESEGIEVEIVSAGSTGTYNITAEYPRVTEIEAGSYVFMDSTYRKLGLEFKCALTVLTTIISRPTPTRIIVDVGLKGITTEFGMPIVKDKEKEAVVYHLSEEHGLIEVDPKVNFKVGDKIELIPSHCCTTVNLHERYYGVRDDVVEVIWPILARGKFQ
jgi:D-serine deaminase-like pyridoxal phosphate-dependent protein